MSLSPKMVIATLG